MARPRKDGLDYFPHDTDAVNDEKVESLRLLYGNDGYAFFFILLERIYRTNDAELMVSAPETVRILSKKIGISEEMFSAILETAFNVGAFDRSEFEARGVLTSRGIKLRADVVLRKRASEREKRGGTLPENNLPGFCGGNTPQTGESKEKYSKEKYSKEKYSKAEETETVSSKADCPHKEIIDLYHQILPSLPKVRTWGESSRVKLRARWNEAEERQSLKWWEDFFLTVKASDFLCGRKDGKGWTASLGWLVCPSNMEKVLNGVYANSAKGADAMTWLQEASEHGNV